jgi:deoxyribodipyrimidine photo-lyase
MALPYRLAIHWHRRDLRISDNTALHHAAVASAGVVPVYVLSAWKKSHFWTGEKRQTFLCRCLESLAKNLESLNGQLIIRCGSAEVELENLARETGADAIFYNQDPDPFGREAEKRVEAMAARLGIACHAHHDCTLHGPKEVLTQDGKPYRVYTPYSKNWLSLEKPKPLPKPRTLHTPPGISSLPLPTSAHWKMVEPEADLIEAGERAAHHRLKTAISDRLAAYGENRDFPAVAGTSRLSQDLRLGLLSPRTIYAKTAEAMAKSRSATARSGMEKFLKELAWREFYMAILWHFPNVLDEEFNPDWRGLWWAEPDETFEAWKQGRTGFPIVDAGMRELLATGHMHNRVRMITAMFLTKDLHINWQEGERYFMHHLVDGDMAANNGGWQWSAGTGADAAPYFRIQNPWTQAKRYDPEGTYMKRWLPALAKVPVDALFAPPKDGQPIAPDYPLPCIDHATERDRTLAIFKTHRQRQ